MLLITKNLTAFLDKYNGLYKYDDYVEAEFRIFYILKQRSDLRYDDFLAIAIDRGKYTLSQAREISKKLKNIIDANGDYTVEYTREIRHNNIKPYNSTGRNEYLKFQPTLYIV